MKLLVRSKWRTFPGRDPPDLLDAEGAHPDVNTETSTNRFSFLTEALAKSSAPEHLTDCRKDILSTAEKSVL